MKFIINVVRTSFTCRRAFKKAGIRPQIPPARKAKTIMRGIMMILGLSGNIRTMRVAAKPPMNSWPSPPIFQNPILNGRQSPTAIKIIGIALVAASVTPWVVVNTLKTCWNAATGSTPATRKRGTVLPRPRSIDKVETAAFNFLSGMSRRSKRKVGRANRGLSPSYAAFFSEPPIIRPISSIFADSAVTTPINCPS